MKHNDIGKNVLFFLQEKGISQVKFADMINSSKQVVNKIIKGKKALRSDEISLIMDALQVSYDDLITPRKMDIPNQEFAMLCGSLEAKETADFIYALVDNLSQMESELEDYGIFEYTK